MFKNESHALAEWVQHYITEGAISIQLIINNDLKHFRDIHPPGNR